MVEKKIINKIVEEEVVTKKMVDTIVEEEVITKAKTVTILKEDSKQLLYFKQFDASLVEADIEYRGGADYFCKKVSKGITMR